MLTNEILSSIDNIDECVMEAEMNVISALCNEYDKAIMIMENYSGNSYDCFDIFMEADESTANNNSNEPKKSKLDGPILGSKGENIIKRILLIIPRLIATLVRSIKKKWDNRKSQQLIKRIEFLENLTQDQKKQLTELQGGLDKANVGLKKTNLKIDDNTTRIYEMGKNNNLYNKSVTKSIDDIDSKLNLVNKKIRDMDAENDVAFDSISKDIDKLNETIKNVDSSVHRHLHTIDCAVDLLNDTIVTPFNFKGAIKFYKDILTMFDELEKFNPYKPSSIDKKLSRKIDSNIELGHHAKYVNTYDDSRIPAISYTKVKEYIKEIDELKRQISDRGSKLIKHLNTMITDVQKSYEGKKDTKGRRDTMQNCQRVLKCVKIMTGEGCLGDSVVSQSFRNLEKQIDLIEKRLHFGLSA